MFQFIYFSLYPDFDIFMSSAVLGTWVLKIVAKKEKNPTQPDHAK
jgi:hypothetical protein